MPFDPVLPDVARRSPPSLLTGVWRGVRRKCPACGEGRLFCGYLAVVETCPVCANDNEQYPSDDFAPYVTIFLVLHLLVPVFVIADRTYDLALWIEGAVTIPVFILATMALLPFAKGGVIGFAWAFGVTRKQSDDEGSAAGK